MSNRFPILVGSFIIIMNLSAHLAKAQQNMTYGLDIHGGQILRHSEKLLYAVPAFTWATEWSAFYQSDGSRAWHHCQSYPKIGASFWQVNLGDEDILGNALVFMPKIEIGLLGKDKPLSLKFQLGTGIAYLSKAYDLIDNVSNNAIGSHWNNATSLQLKSKYQIRPSWQLSLGAGLLHLSNGASRLPNLGINFLSGHLGLHYRPNGKLKISKGKCTSKTKHWSIQLHAGMAFSEIMAIGGPRFPTTITSLGGAYYINDYHRILLGIEHEFNQGVYDFGRSTYYFRNRSQAILGAQRWMIFLADELCFGAFSILLQVGVYWKGKSAFLSFPVYNRLGLRYYLPPIGKPKTQFFLGIYLKSHRFSAEHIALGLGASISK